jgi:hypothetical protein
VKDEQWIHGHSFAICDHKGAETKGARASQQKKSFTPADHTTTSSQVTPRTRKFASEFQKKKRKPTAERIPEREKKRERERQRDKKLNARRRVYQPVLVEIQSGPLEKIKTRSCCNNRGLFRTTGESWP